MCGRPKAFRDDADFFAGLRPSRLGHSPRERSKESRQVRDLPHIGRQSRNFGSTETVQIKVLQNQSLDRRGFCPPKRTRLACAPRIYARSSIKLRLNQLFGVVGAFGVRRNPSTPKAPMTSRYFLAFNRLLFVRGYLTDREWKSRRF